MGKISKLLVDNNMSKAQTISLQSVSPEVLEIIGRKNLDMEYYSGLVNFYAKENIPTYTELILGLPGETYESFAKGMCKVLESGQHSAINVYPCELIPNLLLGSKEYIEKYKMSIDNSTNQVLLCNPSDMGNLGTIIRSAVAFNFDSVVISKGTVVDYDMLNEHDNNFIASILDFSNLYTITYSDISTGSLYIMDVPKDETKSIYLVIAEDE